MIAIIGAGLQGACLALELAALGQAVTLIDAALEPMSEASRWNEGKLHLGFVYANDPSRRSADAMLQASLEFLPTLERLLGRDLSHVVARNRFVYGVPTDSLVTVAQVAAHFEGIARRLAEHGARWPRIFGGSAWLPPERVAVDGIFDGDRVAAAFSTPEIAVDTHALADMVAARLREEPLVRLVTGAEVTSVARQDGMFRLDFADGSSESGFRSVVNASWRSLMRLDATVGCHASRPWLYRYKTAIHVRGSAATIPSCTFIVGPYGDIVNFGDGRFYLSWYPTCRLAMSDQADLPQMADLDSGRGAAIATESLQGLAKLIPGVASIALDEVPNVHGGWIFAWGGSDITDRRSELHQRHDVGAFVDSGYISVNTGKYCMAPLNALRLARRIRVSIGVGRGPRIGVQEGPPFGF
ncbi:FAD-dependent oxidoreductase [Xanthobacter sediminis]|uniref:FAD-dependent oxidoreductase n=1 Tax=Xanthobacter sediminis TaxID=3119926 RepID=UPI003729723C